ncbi:MAG: hypothetical protein HY938_01140 [Nitrosomonadales bacterium]|nr:hypothetical protein [Nitrosomonadales bacterium]
MKNVHLLIPDLFLPKDIASGVTKGLDLPALEKLLARGVLIGSDPSTELSPSTSSGRTVEALENYLCELFGVKCAADAPIAPVGAAFDGLAAGCWLRADPVHLHLDQSRMLLNEVSISGVEAAALCAGMNEYFSGQGMQFFAPHPQRWYVRTDKLPRIRTVPLAQVIGEDVRAELPGGEDAGRWHGVFNEIQMLLHSHPVNEAREARGASPVNSVWLWGGGCSGDVAPQKNYDSVSSDDVLPEMFAAAAGIPFAVWSGQWRAGSEGRQLLVWTGLRTALQRGDLAAWRAALQDFEAGYAQPLWQALRSGKIGRLHIDVPCGTNVRHVRLSRGDTWAFWRRAKPLSRYSMM